jgi:hypothetical protein
VGQLVSHQQRLLLGGEVSHHLFLQAVPSAGTCVQQTQRGS